MDLKTYLELNRLTQACFAKKINVTQGLIHQFVSGKTRVTAERAVEIERATGGAVTRTDLRPDLFGDPIPAKPRTEEAA